MLEEINSKLIEAQQNVLRQHKIESMLEELMKQKNALDTKTSVLKKILDEENMDIEKLEGRTVAKLFYSVLGNLQEKIQKEQQEALAAKLKYDQAVIELAAVELEINKFSTERKLYHGSDEKYRELYEKKKILLLENDSFTAQEIMDLSERVNSSKNACNEIQEAISAGKQVLQHLDQAIESLDDAESCGIWDMLGGGLLTDMVKRSNLDDAKSEVEKTQLALSRFRTELVDIRIDSSINIETDGFAGFADFFFDGLIADWCMQSRINEAQANSEGVKNQVITVMNQLNIMESDLSLHIEQLEVKLTELIQNA